jgi:hypothetical protein
MQQGSNARDTVIPLVPDRLFALAHPFQLDGRPVSTHPASARGFSQFNCHLLVDGEQALLIDTGVAAHESLLFEQLDAILGPASTLSVLVLRLSDFSSVSNARALAERYDIGDFIAGVVPPEELSGWLDFRPEYGTWGEPTGGGQLGSSGRRMMSAEGEVRAFDGRMLEVIRPPLQFIPTYWLFDNATGALFTSDAFTHMWRQDAPGPWLVDEIGDAPSVDELSDYLVDSRYWWLAGADTRAIAGDLSDIRTAHDIRFVCPAFGCVLSGQDVVAHHFDLMAGALAKLGEREPVGPDLVPSYQGAT